MGLKKGDNNLSRIYFHTKKREVEVRGTERAYMNVLCGDITNAIFRPLITAYKEPQRILNYIPKDSYLHSVSSINIKRDFETFISVSDGYLLFKNQKVACFDLILNTALVVGSDPIKLYARIHGQCEIHCYILPNNFEWLSKIIQQGLNSNIFRGGIRGYPTRWDDVLELLKNTKDSPIVLSYSVCDQFPNRFVAKWEDDCDGEDWYKLSGEQQWELAFSELEKDKGLEITPENWDDFYFMDGISAFDFVNDVE